MQPTPAAVRQTIFALLSSMEIDLRMNIAKYYYANIIPSGLYSDALKEKLVNRAEKAGS
jgi:hypothetical protein